MPADLDEWKALFATCSSAASGLSVTACLTPGGGSASSPFLALGADGNEWWVKPPKAGFGKALVAEFVVGRVGTLIGAPTCEVELIDIPAALLPWECAPGVALVAGIGTATKRLQGAIEEIRPSLTRRNDDDNRRRHVGIYALCDLCFFDDQQWLLQADQQWTIHSHDHGWYFPPGGQSWGVSDLVGHADTPKVLPDDPAGLDPDAIVDVAANVRAVTGDGLRSILEQVPDSWGVTAEELAHLGWFLEHRCDAVATRLEDLVSI